MRLSPFSPIRMIVASALDTGPNWCPMVDIGVQDQPRVLRAFLFDRDGFGEVPRLVDGRLLALSRSPTGNNIIRINDLHGPRSLSCHRISTFIESGSVPFLRWTLEFQIHLAHFTSDMIDQLDLSGF